MRRISLMTFIMLPGVCLIMMEKTMQTNISPLSTVELRESKRLSVQECSSKAKAKRSQSRRFQGLNDKYLIFPFASTTLSPTLSLQCHNSSRDTTIGGGEE